MKPHRYILIILIGITLGFCIDFIFNGPLVFAEKYVPQNWTNGLVGYWSFDGKNTILNSTTSDLSVNHNDGTLGLGVGADSADPTPVAGILGQALGFDGVDDYMDVGSSSVFALGAGDFTTELWLKLDDYNASWVSGLIGNFDGNTKGWEIEIYGKLGGVGNQGKVGLRFNNTGGEYWETTQILLNTWYHIAMVYTSSNTTVNFYINSFNTGSSSISGYISPIVSTKIGKRYDGYLTDGLIDEVRIYNRVLSADEIKSHYALTARKFKMASSNPASWTNGLVGYWSFDGKNTILNSTTSDLSGNNNNGTSGSGTGFDASDPTPVAGISGQSLGFDGTNDYVSVGNSASLNTLTDYTIEMWAYNKAGSATYPTLFNRAGQSGSNGFFWCYTGGTDEVNISFQWATGTGYTVTAFSNVFPKDTWTHLSFVFTNDNKFLNLYANGSQFSTTRTLTNALPVDDGTLYLGTYQGNTSGYLFNGLMDEVRIYNRALLASEVQEHYNLTKRKFIVDTSNPNPWTNGLVGYWNFDGKNTILNSTTTDLSGNNNNCTLGSGVGIDSADPKPMAGISGQAFYFDGVDDYINCGHPDSLNFSNNFTVEFNLNYQGSTTINTTNGLILKSTGGAGAANQAGWYVGLTTYGGDGTNIKLLSGLTNGTWGTGNLETGSYFLPNTNQFITFVRSGADLIHYRNGVIDGSRTLATSSYDVSNALDLNINYSNFSKGIIDEVRIYNRALSPTEILQHYQETKRNLKM